MRSRDIKRLVLAGCWVLVAVPGWVQADRHVQLDDERMVVSDDTSWHPTLPGDLDRTLLEKMNAPERKLMNLSPDALIAENEKRSYRINSTMTLYPWLDHFTTQPILTVNPEVPGNVEIKEWRFTVLDPGGGVIWSQQSTQALPDQLIWDGHDQHGQMIDVDMPFYYTLGIIDKGGNPSLLNSQPKRLAALAYPEGGHMLLRLSSQALFKAGNEIYLSDSGELLLKESIKYFVQKRCGRVEITSFGNDTKVGNLQSIALSNYYQKQLNLSKQVFVWKHQQVNDRDKIELMVSP